LTGTAQPFILVDMDKVAEKLDSINKTLERHNEIAQRTLDIMQKPENPFLKTLAVAGIGVSVLGIIQVIDTIIQWFGG
jgi:preprotein translocase subunit Sss1